MEPVSLQLSEIMPSKSELAGKPPRVVVFDADHGDIDLAKSAKVGTTIAREVEKHLDSTHVELVDRKLATKLQNELMLAEMKGKLTYNGPEIADVAIVSVLSQASADAAFSEGSNIRDLSGRVLFTTSPKCNYTGNVSGSIRIYQMPSMKAATSLELGGSVSNSKDNTGNGHCPLSDNGSQQLVRAAAADGIEKLKVDIQNMFAPRGYITEQRSGNGQHIIKVTMGSKHGLKPGSSLEILNLMRTTNPLTNEASVDTFKLGSAKASDQIGNDSAWLIVSEEMASKVRLGQPVRLQFKKGLLDQMNKITSL